jgi:hypothetical protein
MALRTSRARHQIVKADAAVRAGLALSCRAARDLRPERPKSHRTLWAPGELCPDNAADKGYESPTHQNPGRAGLLATHRLVRRREQGGGDHREAAYQDEPGPLYDLAADMLTNRVSFHEAACYSVTARSVSTPSSHRPYAALACGDRRSGRR